MSKRTIMQRVFDMVQNIYSMRKRAILDKIGDPRRNIEDECGHLPMSDYYIDPEQYRQLYHRDPIAKRIVEIYAKESWQVVPEVYESEDQEVSTPFEKAWLEMGKRLSGGKHYKDQKGRKVWNYLRRLDIASGIGHYGILIFGLEGDIDFSKPAVMQPGSTVRKKLLYMKVVPEYLCQISQFDDNPASPRYRMPESYLVTLADPRNVSEGYGFDTGTIEVHWTRVLHLPAEGVETQEVFGPPWLRWFLNRVLDLKKLYGSSAEMYYKGAFPGLFLGTDPALGGDVDIDDDSAQDEIEQYQNGLQRVLALIGFKPEQLAPQVVDPTPQLERQLDAICIGLGVPKRIFTGSERGELASSQDDASWNSRLRARQDDHITPMIIVPFVERLIDLGVLPEPGEEGFTVHWPDRTSQTASEKSAVTFQLTQALAQYITSGAHLMMTPIDFFTKVWGMDEQEAKSVVEKVKESDEYKKALTMYEEALKSKELDPNADENGNSNMKRDDRAGGRTGKPPSDSSNGAAGRPPE